MPKIDLMQGNCLDLMSSVADKSVDAIICDLPYGTTACIWDTVIPFEPLWAQYKRVIKDNGAIVLTASQPFTSKLVMSNLEMFKYEWVWEKTKSFGFTNAKNKPMNKHEGVCIFAKGTCANKSDRRMNYFPQGLLPYNKIVSGRKDCSADKKGHRFHRPSHKSKRVQEFTNYPNSILKISSEGKTIHPTQKPVALMEYLIKTYTNEGDTVLDNCMGSGTTGVACVNLNRNFIGIEMDEVFFNLASDRINKPSQPNLPTQGERYVSTRTV